MPVHFSQQTALARRWARPRYRLAGLLFSGLGTIGLHACTSPAVQPISQSLGWEQSAFFQPPPEPDPAVVEVVERYLQTLRSRGIAPNGQGIVFQAGLSRLAMHQAQQPRSAASITKVATTVAAVEKWGLAHRFITTFYTTGTVVNGVLQGDLVIQGTGNPFFVWEEAIAVGNALTDQGITQIAGDLVIVGPFFMNYKTDGTVAGQLLRVALDSLQWPREAQMQYAELPPETPKPQVTVQGTVRVEAAVPSQATPLFRHESVNLANILKQMNIYSNNVMAQVLAESAGGADAVAQLAAQVAGVPPEEIQLINGSGLGVENRISPRASVAMLIALDQRLAAQNASITDVLPVAGRDRGGTLKDRNFPPQTLLKTGTLNGVSALAGIVPTRDRGWVWFAILNGGGDILQFRRQQDALLQAVTGVLGTGTLLDGQGGIPDEPLGDAGRILP
ncbi:MAG: D-alanyl-D-alanine carboxypeptidase [Spirulina sp. SIO3F2]|nr:D-alanyl-D-alanine carboxypeptidase [Spirulina sp. SIO3F2]